MWFIILGQISGSETVVDVYDGHAANAELSMDRSAESPLKEAFRSLRWWEPR